MDETKYQNVTLYQNAWYGDSISNLHLPKDWSITICKMASHDTKELSKEKIQSAIDNPIGTDSISKLAKGKKRVVIIFDDLHRPTPTSKIISFVLKELHQSGIIDRQISFIAATAAHRPMIREDFVKKLGEDIVEKYPVYTHNPFGTMDSLKKLGRTSYGTPVEVNREVAEADLKLGIGCIIPHSLAGFSGGGKIILPGCASIKSIRHNHEEVAGGKPTNFNPHPSTGVGKVDENVARDDIEEAARIVGLDMAIDVVLNNKREIIGVFAGDFILEHRKGVAFAKRAYSTNVEPNADIVISNAYPIDSNPSIALRPVIGSIRNKGDIVIIGSSTEGIYLNYIADRFGTEYKVPLPHSLPKRARKIFLLSKYFTKKDTITKPFNDSNLIEWNKEWHIILKELMLIHNYEAKVVIYPYSGIQYFVSNNEVH